jgi:hypothetical protein
MPNGELGQSAANIQERIGLPAQRISKPKFLKPYRGFAGKAADIKDIANNGLWVAEEAVTSELVSTCNSLLTGKNTGNFIGF